MENVTETNQYNVNMTSKHQLFLFKNRIYQHFKLLLHVFRSDKVYLSMMNLMERLLIISCEILI